MDSETEQPSFLTFHLHRHSPSSPPCRLQQLQRTLSQRRRGTGAYVPGVHCGSIRQAAQVVCMRELAPLPLRQQPGGGPATGAALATAGVEVCGDEESIFSALAELDMSIETLSGGSSSSSSSGGGTPTAAAAGALQAAPAAQPPNPSLLAGAMAASGILRSWPSLAAEAAPARRGLCELQDGVPGSAPTPSSLLSAALLRQGSAVADESPPTVAEVTFRFMHQPGKPRLAAAD